MRRMAVGVVVLGLMTGLLAVPVAGEQGTSAAPTGAVAKHPEPLQHRLTQLTAGGVTLTIETYDPEEVSAIFTADLTRNGIQPLLLQIDNHSDQTYAFQKTDVDGDIPASQLAQYAHANPAMTAVQNATWLVLSVPVDAVSWATKSLLRARVQAYGEITKHKPPENRDLQADFVRMEMVDHSIAPAGSLAGYVFIHRPQPGALIRIKLTNVHTQAPLVFECVLGSGKSGA